MKGVALALPAAAVASLFLFRKKASAAAPKPPVIVPSPQGAGTVAERMARVIATGNPAAIRFEAGRLRQEGYTSQAAELERVAATIEAGQVKPPAPVVPGVPAPAPAPVKPPMPAPLPPVVIVTPPLAPVPVPQAPAPATIAGPNLKRGSSGARVLLVQQRLASLGYSLGKSGADGQFGPSTEAAVKAFQKSNGLGVDGIVGPATQVVLAGTGAKGPAPAAAVKPPAAVKPAPVVVKPTPVLPAGPPPSSAPAGRAPTITAALRSLPALLRNGASTGYKAPASSGQAVRDWQQVLRELGFTTAAPDGKFGPGTEAATRAFQQAANSAAAKAKPPKKPLTVDGVVGPATVARAAEARVVTTGPAVFTGDWFGYDPGVGLLLAPSTMQPDSPLPGIIPPMTPTAPDPERALAARLTHMLVTAPRGAEDRTLVALFQSRNGLRPTGYYGPSVALALAQRFGIVPPAPIYWTESRTGKAKSNYRDALRMLAERDPQRSEEWLRAAAV
jgi:peptidoglycan hydrolase-like protein with peptidoglycan-binding domain